jgi:hypothetical protein
MITQSQPSGYKTPQAVPRDTEEDARCHERQAASVDPHRLLVSVSD